MVVLEVVIILILVLINGVLSMSELSIVSSRRGRLRAMIEAGDKNAEIALRLNESPEHMLSTVQIGITLMGILSGVFGGATFSGVLAGYLVTAGISAPTAEPIAFGVTVLFITYLSLVIGELVPKQIALSDPEKVATKVARLILLLSKITQPLVKLLSHSSTLVLKLLGIKRDQDSTVTEEEVQSLIDEGTQSGLFEEEEREMVRSIFRMSDLCVKDLMQPRTEIDWLDTESSREEILQEVERSPHSYFPVAQGSLDNAIGIVAAKDLLQLLLSEREFNIRAVMHEVRMIPETATAFSALEELRQRKISVALIVDEYGGVDGLITLSDLLSAIVGDVEEAITEKPINKRSDGSYLIDAALPLSEFFELVRHVPSAKELHGSRTLAGFILSQFGHVPEASESFRWKSYEIEVVDLDGKRIDKVLVTPVNDAHRARPRAT